MPSSPRASLIAPDDVPDAEYPMILTTGRQLEHWHTGSMTRRSKVLDAVEPEANCSLHPKTLRALGVAAGGHVRLTTKRGSILVMARADRSVSEDMVFLPFAFVEGGGKYPDQLGGRSLWQDPRVQVFRR